MDCMVQRIQKVCFVHVCPWVRACMCPSKQHGAFDMDLYHHAVAASSLLTMNTVLLHTQLEIGARSCRANIKPEYFINDKLPKLPNVAAHTLAIWPTGDVSAKAFAACDAPMYHPCLFSGVCHA